MKNIDLEVVRNSIRNIPDFPRPGIQFKDVSTSFCDPDIFKIGRASCRVRV